MRPLAVLIAALAVAGPPALVAQGGEKATRGAGVAPVAPLARPRLAPARSILQRLVGTWRFEIWFAGNIGGPPDVAGTRVVRALFDDLRVEWSEEIENSPVRGQGVIGFDSRSERFFSTAVFNAGSGAELMTGTLELADGLITFIPIGLAPEADPSEQLRRSSALTMLDADHFTWVALDRGWRALFTRLPPPPPPQPVLPPPADSVPPASPEPAPSPPDSAEVMTGPPMSVGTDLKLVESPGPRRDRRGRPAQTQGPPPRARALAPPP